MIPISQTSLILFLALLAIIIILGIIVRIKIIKTILRIVAILGIIILLYMIFTNKEAIIDLIKNVKLWYIEMSILMM